jgi:photosystem II stability/assembly factor-like uncharacterized protein
MNDKKKSTPCENASILLLALLVCCFFGLSSASSGFLISSKQGVPFAGRWAEDMFFLPTGQGWILTYEKGDNIVLKTDNRGVWSKLHVDYHLVSIAFSDGMHGWAIAENSHEFQLLGTSDGGANWALVRNLKEIPTSETTSVEVLLTSRGHGLILAIEPEGKQLVFRADEQGETVTQIPDLSNKSGIARAVFVAPDGQNLWAVGNDSVLHSLDSGKSWSAQVTGSTLPGDRRAILFMAGLAFDDGRVFVVGQSAGGVVFKSEDFGVTWKLVGESKRTNALADVAFWDKQHGCAVGLSRLLYCTSDSGDSWREVSEIPKAKTNVDLFGSGFRRIAFANGGKRAWVLENGGALFESIDAAHTWKLVDIDKLEGGRDLKH